MTGNCHVPCGVGEKLEITSNAYLLLTFSAITQFSINLVEKNVKLKVIIYYFEF